MRTDVVDLIAERSGRLSPAQAVDFVAVDGRGISQAEWARRRDITPQAVSKNLAQAREELENNPE